MSYSYIVIQIHEIIYTRLFTRDYLHEIIYTRYLHEIFTRELFEQNNKIVYAGAAHIDVYGSVISKLFPGSLKFSRGGKFSFGEANDTKISNLGNPDIYNRDTNDGFSNFS